MADQLKTISDLYAHLHKEFRRETDFSDPYVGTREHIDDDGDYSHDLFVIDASFDIVELNVLATAIKNLVSNYVPEKNPCSKCGGTDLSVHMDTEDDGSPSQYMRVFCKCGNKGGQSWYLKGCGLEDFSDEYLAVSNWNSENPK